MFDGVLDRIEDGIATILIEEENKEFTLPQDELPNGSKEGTWFSLKKQNDTFIIHEINEEKTASNWQQSKDLMDKLKSKKRTSKFKRK